MRSRVTKIPDVNIGDSTHEPERQVNPDHDPFMPVTKSTPPIFYKAKYPNTKS